MLRIMISLLCLFCFSALGGDVQAVEKKDKDKKAVVEKAKVPKPAATKQKPAQVKPRDTLGVAANDSSQVREFDRFVDKNKNGIDDRKEKLVPKSKATEKKTEKQAAAKKTAKK